MNELCFGGASTLVRRLAFVKHLLRQRGPLLGATEGAAAGASALAEACEGLLASESLAQLVIGWAATADVVLLSAAPVAEAPLSATTAVESVQEKLMALLGAWRASSGAVHSGADESEPPCAHVGGVTAASAARDIVGSSWVRARCNTWASGLARCAGTSSTRRRVGSVLMAVMVVAAMLPLLVDEGTFRRLRRCIADRGLLLGGVDFVEAASGAVSSGVSGVLATASPPTDSHDGWGGAADGGGTEPGSMAGWAGALCQIPNRRFSVLFDGRFGSEPTDLSRVLHSY